MGLGSPELPCYLGAEGEEMPLWDTTEREPAGAYREETFCSLTPTATATATAFAATIITTHLHHKANL